MNPQDSFIGRYVAFLILPFATALAALIGVKAKAWFGVDLDQGEIIAWIVSVAVGISVWLYNRGRHEVASMTGLDEETIDKIVKKVAEEKLPQLPTAPAPGDGSPAAPGAPPTPTSGPGGISSGQ
jgi:hypothetical protein